MPPLQRKNRTVVPDPHTGLRIFVRPTVVSRAADHFADRFPLATAEFKAGENATLLRQLYKVFRDATPVEHVRNNAAFMAQIAKPGNPEFHFRRNRDMLFVCIANRDNVDRYGEPDPQLSVHMLYRLNPADQPILQTIRHRAKSAIPQSHTPRSA